MFLRLSRRTKRKEAKSRDTTLAKATSGTERNDTQHHSRDSIGKRIGPAISTAITETATGTKAPIRYLDNVFSGHEIDQGADGSRQRRRDVGSPGGSCIGEQRAAAQGNNKGTGRHAVRRWCVYDRDQRAETIPIRAAKDEVRDKDLASEHFVSNRRHLSGKMSEILEWAILFYAQCLWFVALCSFISPMRPEMFHDLTTHSLICILFSSISSVSKLYYRIS